MPRSSILSDTVGSIPTRDTYTLPLRLAGGVVRRMARTAWAAVLPALLVAAPGLQSQQIVASDDSTVVDRVAAVVGDSVITLSEVQLAAELAAQQNPSVQPRQVLDQLIQEQLILQAAARDTTLRIEPERLDQLVEDSYQEVQNRFGSAQQFQQALQAQGLTPSSYRDQLRDQIRRRQLQQMYIQRRLQSAPPVAVTEREMRELFEAGRADLDERPEELTVEQVLIGVSASDPSWADAEQLADSLYGAIQAGADFAEVAREYSEDPGSAEEGGDLGWFRRGTMMREFEEVAFQLPNDSISRPVRTELGYHLIKVEQQRPGEVKARHILIRPEGSADDIGRAQAVAEEAARRARAGEAIDSLRAEYDQTDEPGQFTVPRRELTEVPYPGYSDALAGASEGDVVGPVETEVRGQPHLAVLRVRQVREAGELTFEDVRSTLRQNLLQQKRIERIFESLRETTYVDIRM